MRRPLSLLALLAPCLWGYARGDQSSSSAAVSTAPIFLPDYDKDSWSAVRGSIVSSDAKASQTTYTIFCPVQTPETCEISLDFPFVIVEGPDTVAFHGTKTSTFIADLGCKLDGFTAATCSGYSSYRSGYANGLYSGPTEVSWTSTFTGTGLQWGVLTLAAVPTQTTDSLELAGSLASESTVTGTAGAKTHPTGTEEGLGVTVQANTRWTLIAALASLVAALCLT